MADIVPPIRIGSNHPENNEMFVHAFARGLHVIRSFGEQTEKQTLSDVARRSNISRASARRLLHTLVHLGYVDSDGKHFWLKPKILDLGYSYIASKALAGVAQDAMNDLAMRQNSSASMVVLDGKEVVYVVRSAIRNGSPCTGSIGGRHPAYIMAAGRILLAELSDTELDDYLETTTFTRYTPYTVTDRKMLREIIRSDGKKGYSIVRREMNEGVCAIAMPVRDKDGDVIASLGLSIRPDLSMDRAAVQSARRELSETVDTINDLIRMR